MASAEGYTETVKVLLQEKADIKIQDTVSAFSSRQKICSYCLENKPLLLVNFCYSYMKYLVKHVIVVPYLTHLTLCNR